MVTSSTLWRANSPEAFFFPVTGHDHFFTETKAESWRAASPAPTAPHPSRIRQRSCGTSTPRHFSPAAAMLASTSADTLCGLCLLCGKGGAGRRLSDLLRCKKCKAFQYVEFCDQA